LEKKGEKGYSFLAGKLVWNSPRTFYELYRNQNKLLRILHKKIIEARHKDVIDLLEK
jgi:hypothetical protein